jgi:ectoine hydroxylase-related dioxygenase (phytanoyl-CoA dioxygenase family)
VVRHLALIFDQAPVAMQSLFFEYGSEQGLHQDFPYVQAQHLSHLIGCWVALEDVTADSGPLFYYSGSHRLPKYDWGGGSLRFDGQDDGQDDGQVEAFEAHLAKACADAGLERVTFHAKKGDVFLWHAALVHGGSAATDRALTRKSFVVHFSTREGYPRDRRWPDQEPILAEINGGFLYRPPPASKLPLLRRVKRKLGALVRKIRRKE